MGELHAALIKAKSTFSAIKKNKTNPHFHRKYADLEVILSAVEPSLLKFGLIIVSSVEVNSDSNCHQLIVGLYHSESNTEQVCVFNLPENVEPQKLGSYLTYYRRYGICSLLNIAAEDDDDAELTTNHNEQSIKQAQVKRAIPY
jgi:hypothetical protein